MSGQIKLDGKNVTYSNAARFVPRLDYQLIIASRNEKRIQDVSMLIRDLTWTTRLLGSPGQLDFNLVKDLKVSYLEGDQVTLLVNDVKVFKGYVFSKDKNEKGEIFTTCYDQLRFLKARQSYNFSNQTAGAIVKKMADDFGLRWGHVADSKYKIPSLVVDDKECLDTITRAIQETEEATGQKYLLYDSFGLLNLQAVEKLATKHLLGEGSFTAGYNYQTSIDKKTYNYIKLIRPTETGGLADAFIANSPSTLKRWGLLQHYEKIDANLSAHDAKKLALSKLEQYNRPQRTVRLRCLGVLAIRAGTTVAVYLPGMGDINLAQRLLVNSARHHFSAGSHTMELDCEIFYQPDSNYSVATLEKNEFELSSYKAAQKAAQRAQESFKKSSAKSGSGTVSKGGSRPYRYPHHSGFTITCRYKVKGAAWACGWHSGVDFVGTGSKNIYAVTTGKVSKVATDRSYGKHVIVKHDDGYLSLYAHLSNIYVSLGQRVDSSSCLGVEGSTGNVSGRHLHLEIHKGSYSYPSGYNPLNFF
jgi:hypothetical protein